MKLLKLYRALNDGVRVFFRNKWLTVATISILTFSLYVVSITLLVGLTGKTMIASVRDSIDINVYFNPGTTEDEITSIKEIVVKTEEVDSVDYVSNDDALKEFLIDTENDPIISQAIEEIGENPLLSYLVIHSNDPGNYNVISLAIENSGFADKVSHTNFNKNKDKIEKLSDIVNVFEKIGFTVGVVLMFVAVLITFNTIRLNMYSRKNEFEVMRLVGASNAYVQIPTVFEGVLYGFFSSMFAVILVFLSAKSVAPLFEGVMSQSDITSFYWKYFWLILVGVMIFGILIGVFSSLIAIRRYLKI
ncbi:cell division protein FtsX [Patescibacteria group bacterium]